MTDAVAESAEKCSKLDLPPRLRFATHVNNGHLWRLDALFHQDRIWKRML